MTVSVATTRYVKALFALAKERGEDGRVRAEMEALGRAAAQVPELAELLRDPRVPVDTKLRGLRAAGFEQASPTLLDFVAYALEHRRPEVVLEAPEEFLRLDREARGIEVVVVETAQPLGADARDSLQARLEEMTGKTVQLEERAAPELIGGIRIRIGSRMYDGSVRRRLDDLAAHLMAPRSA